MSDSTSQLIKTPSAAACDDVVRAVGELYELYRTLADQQEEALGALADHHRVELAEALGAFQAARRADGDLPAAGDLELAQWKSLAARIKALIAEAPESAVFAEEALARCREIEARIAAVDRQSVSDAVLDALRRLARSVEHQVKSLQAFARSARNPGDSP